MQVLISVTRTTRYTSIVEMPKAKYDRLNEALEDGDDQAAQEVNDLIDVHDWQDDSLEDVDEFKPYIKTK